MTTDHAADCPILPPGFFARPVPNPEHRLMRAVLDALTIDPDWLRSQTAAARRREMRRAA